MTRTLPDARWDCRGCGACCQGFSFGPVEPEIIAGLHDADIGAKWAPAAEEWATQQPDGSWYLTHRDGHCVFLQDDKLCAVHRLLGEPAKPWFCREFPIHAVQTSRGMAVVARPECSGLHESFLDGANLDGHAEAALALPRPVPRLDTRGRDVVLWPGAAVDGSVWDQVEDVVLGLLEGPQPVGAAIARVRTQVTAWVKRPGPPPSAAVCEQIAASVLQGLIAACKAPAPPAFTEKLAELRALLEGVGPAAVLDEDAQRYEALVARSDVLSQRFATVGGLPAMLGLWWLESRIGAGHAAGTAGPAEVGPIRSKLRRGLVLPPVWQAIQQARPALEALFLHAE